MISSFIGSIRSEISGAESIFQDHYIFTEQGWKKALTFEHPRLALQTSTDVAAYDKFKVKAPPHIKGNLSTFAEFSAMSCLWSRKELLEHGYK